MSTPIEDLEAGDYELVSEIFDQPTNDEGKTFTFKRYRKGDTVTLDLAEAQRLYKAGAVVLPGEREVAAAAFARAQYEAALAALPEDIRAQVLADVAGAAPATSVSDPEPVVEKPKRVSPKEDWVAYAVSRGADEAEAEASTKEDLIARFGG